MSLIIDAIKKAQQLRSKELKGLPFFKGPHPLNKKRSFDKHSVWVFSIAGLGIILLLLWAGSYFFPLSRIQQIPKMAAPERQDPLVDKPIKNEFPGPQKKEVQSTSSEKPYPEGIREEPLEELKAARKTEKKGLKPTASLGSTPSTASRSSLEEPNLALPNTPTDSVPEAKAEKGETPPTPAAEQPVQKPSAIYPEQEAFAKPTGMGLESRGNPARTAEIHTHFNLGVEYTSQREYLKAIQAYQRVIELDPTYGEAYNNLGIIYQEVGDFDRAFQAYQKSIEVNPRNEKAYNNLGILLFLKNRYEESRETFQKALTINSSNIESHINLGVLFKKQGQFDKAVEHYQKALSLNPLSGETHYNIGLLYEQLKHVDLAISHYQRFILLASKTHPNLVSKVQRHLNYLKSITKDGEK